MAAGMRHIAQPATLGGRLPQRADANVQGAAEATCKSTDWSSWL